MNVEEYKESIFSNNNYGILPPPTSAQKGLDILIKHFLGDGWYSVNPINQEQVNTEAICLILELYDKARKKNGKQ